MIARKHATSPARVTSMVVKELGPVLKLQLAPAFIEGGTEVVFKISAQGVATGQQIANFTSHWKNGGTFVIKGVGTLEKDMYSALLEALPNK